MANTFTITINNKSNSTQSYILFCDLPVISGPGKAFQNVLMQAKPVPSGNGSATFTITSQFYGICGTSDQNLQAGVAVSTTDYEDVTLGVGNTAGTTLNMTVDQSGGVSFLPPGTDTGPVGSYTIQTDSSFSLPDPNNTFIGLGGLNMKGKVVPVATFLASPTSSYNISPVVRYYIATGSYVQGQIINVQQIGITQLCDFTNTKNYSKTYTQNSNGTYSLLTSEADVKAIKLAGLRADKVELLGPDSLTTVGEENKDRYANGGYTSGGALLKEDTLVKDFQKALLDIFSKTVIANS